jgi:hypothetical protein
MQCVYLNRECVFLFALPVFPSALPVIDWIAWKSSDVKIFFVAIPFYLQYVPVHSTNCVRTYTVACRRVLSSVAL